MSSEPTRVVVVGGGAAGVITATTLVRRTSRRPLDVTVVERAEVAGPGLAYATPDPLHLLNNYAGRMSALDDDPAHLVRWCRAEGLDVTGETFLSRQTYGRYLASLLDTVPAPPGSRVSRLRDEVVDLSWTESGYLVTTASGPVLTADAVVLALGNPPPRRPSGLDVDEDAWAADPWDPDLLTPVGDDDRVLLVGTGLTTVDVAAQLATARPGVRLTDWRCLVESLKLVAHDVWTTWSREDREQFVRHVGRYWEISRHRMAPAMAQIIDDLLATGRLTVALPGDVDAASYDLVVNCTGPAPVSTPGWNPLVDRLAVKGMLWPGPLGLGVDVDTHGALVDADGVSARGLFAVGAARRGSEWEVAAVPDLRRQAVALARHLGTTWVTPAAELVG